MGARQYMIVDLEKRGELSMFITKQAAYIKTNIAEAGRYVLRLRPDFFNTTRYAKTFAVPSRMRICCPVKVLRGKK